MKPKHLKQQSVNSPPCTSINSSRISFVTLCVGFVSVFIRIWAFYGISHRTHESIRENVQISTPLTDFKRLKEGVFLFQNGVNPYEGNLYFQPPMFLAFFSIFPLQYAPFLWTLIDICIAYFIYHIALYQRIRDAIKEDWTRHFIREKDEIYQDLLLKAKDNSSNSENPTTNNQTIIQETKTTLVKSILARFLKRNSHSSKNEPTPIVLSETELENHFTSDEIEKRLPPILKVDPEMVMLSYLWNPFVFLTCIGRSTIVFNTLCMTVGLYFAMKGRYLNMVALCVAFATYLSVYPFMLVIPFGLLLHEHEQREVQQKDRNSLKRTLAMLVTLTSIYVLALFGLSYQLLGSWNFLSSFYGTLFLVSDLQPNIGVYWYFVIEMFDHFRTFFVCVFQLLAFIFAVPTGITFRNDPMMIVILYSVVMAFMKSYPSLGDVAFTYTLLPLYSRLFPYVSFIGPVLGIQMGISVLMPVFYGLWMSSGAGNANFFYAATLAFGISQVMLVRGLISGYQRKEFDRENLCSRQLRLLVLQQD